METLTLTLPPSLDADAVRALDASLTRAAQDPAVRAIVLTGSAGVFCRGMQLDAASLDRANPSSAMEDFARCLTTLRLGPKPAVAVVDGVALGGGVGLAAACDVLLATENARFGLPEALFGLAPHAILPLVVERLGAQRARRWAMDPSTRAADDPALAGLIDARVASADIPRTLSRELRALGRCAPCAVSAIKRHVGDSALGAAIVAGARRTAEAMASAEVRAAVAAFAAGDAPWGQP